MRIGADAILLIVAALYRCRTGQPVLARRELQLDVLCEVHDGEELQRALDAGCETIGVNNRNLHTFQVDLNTSLQLAELMPAGVVKGRGERNRKRRRHRAVAAGRIRRLPDRRIADARPVSRRSLARIAGPIGGGALMTRQRSIWVKICGTTNLHDAQLSVAAGADALGFIFAPSPRQVEVAEAAEIIAALPAKWKRSASS